MAASCSRRHYVEPEIGVDSDTVCHEFLLGFGPACMQFHVTLQNTGDYNNACTTMHVNRI